MGIRPRWGRARRAYAIRPYPASRRLPRENKNKRITNQPIFNNMQTVNYNNENEMKNVKCNDEAALAGLPFLARATEHAAELKAMASERLGSRTMLVGAGEDCEDGQVRFSFSYTGPRGLLMEMLDGLLDDEDLREALEQAMARREEEENSETTQE